MRRPPPAPGNGDPESLPVAAAEARTVTPLLVSGIEAVARSRLLTVPADTRLVEVAARLSSAQISVVVVCDAAGAAMGTITETVLVRHLGLGQADFFTTRAGEVMTQEFTTCAPQELLSDVLAMMHTRGLVHVLLKQTSKPSEYVVDPFDADEREALLRCCRADERAMVQFMFATGLRPGELIALKWPKIDWIGKKAFIDEAMVVGVEGTTKTLAGTRMVDLSAQAVGALIAQKPVSYEAQEHIWLNPRTGKAWTGDAQVRKTLWIPLLQRSGVRYRNPYQTRHTFASAMLTDGANPFYVADQLGHVDAQLVFTTYGKFIPADYKKNNARLTLVPSQAVHGEAGQ